MITPDESTAPRRGSVNWFFLALLSLWFLLLYLGVVLPFDTYLPWLHSYYFAPPVIILSFVATFDFLRRWRSRGRAEEARDRLQKMAFLCIVLLACFLVVDIGNSVYLNLRQGPGEGLKLLASRETDPHTWDGELMPQRYFPTNENFFLYKPGETSGGCSYGELYYPALLQHQVFKESVLELRKVEYSIDEYGLRNTHRPEKATVFALGDSFCFGYHMTQADTWPEPEEGVVIAAGAGAMGVKLGQSVTVAGETVWRPELGTGQAPDADCIDSAVSMIWRGLAIWLVAVLLVVIAGWFA